MALSLSFFFLQSDPICTTEKFCCLVTHSYTKTPIDAPGKEAFLKTPWEKELEALERLYRSTGLIFLQWQKEVFNNYHSIPAF